MGPLPAPTVDPEPGSPKSPERGSLSADPDGLLCLAVRGYWVTRCLADMQPGLLGGLLARQQSREALEDALAADLGISRQHVWSTMDGIVRPH